MKGISRSFAQSGVSTRALVGIDLDIARGEYLSVSGPSGSGKSTLLSIMGLLDSATDGEYWLDGRLISELSLSERALTRNRVIGFVFQAFNLIHEMTVKENTGLSLTYRGISRKEREQRVTESLDRVGMGEYADRLPSQLSGGQQQRVAVARALAGRPSVLLADEPTGNLDTKNADDIMDLLSEAHQSGTTVVVVTHDPRFADRANRELHMKDGRIVG